MKDLNIHSAIMECQMEELTSADRELIQMAIEATERSYARFSNFCVGAAVELENGVRIMGCNQENAAFPAGICAERSAIFAAGAQYPDHAVRAIAIAARNTEGQLTAYPVSPCGICRQVLIETETRFNHAVRILLYGTEKVFLTDSIRHLMPLSFTEF